MSARMRWLLLLPLLLTGCQTVVIRPTGKGSVYVENDLTTKHTKAGMKFEFTL